MWTVTCFLDCSILINEGLGSVIATKTSALENLTHALLLSFESRIFHPPELSLDLFL